MLAQKYRSIQYPTDRQIYSRQWYANQNELIYLILMAYFKMCRDDFNDLHLILVAVNYTNFNKFYVTVTS